MNRTHRGLFLAVFIFCVPVSKAYAQHRTTFCCFSQLRAKPTSNPRNSKNVNLWLGMKAQKIVDTVYKKNQLLVSDPVVCSFRINRIGQLTDLKVDKSSTSHCNNKNAIKLLEKTFDYSKIPKDLYLENRIVAKFRSSPGYFIELDIIESAKHKKS